MHQLSAAQRDLVTRVVGRVGAIPGITAIVLSGSHARGRAQPDSDIDLGILYSEALPFPLEPLRLVAAALNDTPDPVVTGPWEWGPWVNGGAWLTIGGQRVDLLYRSLEHLERVIAEAEVGRYEVDYAQQPPFGFFSATFLGDLSGCVPLVDPGGRLAPLKQRVATYPEALRHRVVQDQYWAAEFGLQAFARKFAALGDSYGTAACLARAVHQMVLALFALNRRYLVNDKTALVEIAEFERAPEAFGQRVQDILAHVGTSAHELDRAVSRTGELLREAIALSDGLYQPRFEVPA